MCKLHDFQTANTATIMTLMFMVDNVYFSTEETQRTLTMAHQPSPSAIPIKGTMYLLICGNVCMIVCKYACTARNVKFWFGDGISGVCKG